MKNIIDEIVESLKNENRTLGDSPEEILTILLPILQKKHQLVIFDLDGVYVWKSKLKPDLNKRKYKNIDSLLEDILKHYLSKFFESLDDKSS